jgi:ABC-type branched-subunit amino acid transport system substrate-binding protein
MKTIRSGRSLGKVWAVPLVLLLAVLAVIPLAVACGGGEEEKEGTATPGATATAAVTPKASPAASPGAIGPGVTDTEIILGMHAALSGLGVKQVTDSFLAYIEYVNEERGGVCGRNIVVKREDDGNTEEGALAVTRKLVEEDHVLAIVGSLGPETAAVEYMNENHIPDLMISSFEERLADPERYPWVTVSVGSWYHEARNFANYINENLPGKKVGILYPNIEAGEDQLRGLKDHLDPGNPLVLAEPYEPTEIDLRAHATRLYNAGAEVVVLTTSIGPTGQFLKQAQRLDWHPQVLLQYENSDPMLFENVPGELLEGAISFHAYKMPNQTDDPAIAEHERIMTEYGGPAPGTFSINWQVIGEVMVETLNRTCDNLTREGVMQAALSFDHWRSELMYPGTYVNTSPTDHRVVSQGPMQQVVLENGKPKWKLVAGPYEFG